MYAYFDKHGINFDVDVRQFPDPAAYLAKFFVLHWSIKNMGLRGLRIFLYILFTIGLALIAIPAAFTFLQVSWIPVNHLL